MTAAALNGALFVLLAVVVSPSETELSLQSDSCRFCTLLLQKSLEQLGNDYYITMFNKTLYSVCENELKELLGASSCGSAIEAIADKAFNEVHLWSRNATSACDNIGSCPKD